MSGIINLFAVVRGPRCPHMGIRAFFHVARLTVRRTATFVIGQGILRLLIIQEMCACLPTETGIRSRTNTKNSQAQIYAEKEMECFSRYLNHRGGRPCYY
jgi:hypothetical protein